MNNTFSSDGVTSGPAQHLRPAAIVAIGASAGGLEPLKRFFSLVPDKTGIAYVVLQHLAPDHESILDDILARQTSLVVKTAAQGMRIEPDTIYVLPPAQDLHIEQGILQLRPPERQHGTRMPIDTFMRALATDQRENAAGIILSGSGSDGTRGIRDIKECGGMVMVQQPDEAAYSDMPRSALQTEQADYILPVDKLPQALVRYVQHNELFDSRQGNEPGAGENVDYSRELEDIVHILHSQTEHDFHDYKYTTLLRRIQRRMGLKAVGSLDEYIHLLRNRPEEIQALVQDLLICVTAFFRNPGAWKILRNKVLKKLIDNKLPKQTLRIWIPGCATGEEAYSMAILVAELLESRRDLKVQIFATDLSNNALKTARAGIYPETIVNDVGVANLQRYFVQESDSYRIVKHIREMVIFAAQDIKGDPPFLRLDLISCRNLLIYLEADAQQQILARMHYALNPGAYLFLGTSETPSRLPGGFEAVSRKWHIYRRNEQNGPAQFQPPTARLQPLPAEPERVGRRPRPGLQEIAAGLLLRQTRSAVILVNDRLQPLYIGGDTEKFLMVSEGEQRNNLLDMARPGLPLKLRSVLQKAHQEKALNEFTGAYVRQSDGGTIRVNGSIQPVTGYNDSDDLYFVKLDEVVTADNPQHDAGSAVAHDDDDLLVRQLEHELHEARSELSTTTEQLEQANEALKAANEEAMSVNEELQSGNEELEASKEELQSLNEELTTLNAQLEEKIRELEHTNNDLDNLLSSTQLAVVFLDTQFRIRNFTPQAVDLFHLIRSDIGRPISDLVHKFSGSDRLLDDAGQVLKTLTPLQQEVVTGDQRWFLRRILPYRTQDNRIQGVVLTFHDISQIKAVQQQLVVQEEQLRLVTNALPILISYLDRDTKYRYVNAGYERWFGVPAEQIIGRTVAEVAGEEAYRKVTGYIQRVLAGERCSFDETVVYSNSKIRYVHAEYVPHWDDNHQVVGFYALVQDISERKQAEQAVADSEREFRAIFELSGSGKTLADPETTRYLRVNRRFCEITGYSEQELLQKTYADLTHPEDRAADRARVGTVLRGEQTYWTSEKRYLHKNGDIIWVLVSGTLVSDSEGRPLYTVATIQDIDSRKRAEQALRDSEERFRTLADNIAQLVWIADRLGWATWYNKRWYDYTGTTLEEMTDNGWEKVNHPDHFERVSAKLNHCLDNGIEWEDVFPLRGKDGNYRWFLSNAIPIRDDSGAIQRWFGSNTDITEQIQMEEALKEADQRKDEFLATLAHELRNPLAPLRSGLELLDMTGNDEGTTLQLHEMMSRQVRHLTRLVDDLLDVSRITRGKVELRISRVELQGIIHNALETVENFIDGFEHQLTLDLPVPPVWLDADPVRLAQVFANLLHNAAKYTPRRGQIRVMAQLSGPDQEREIIVTISDSGIGIPADKLDRIFSIFTQLKQPMEHQQSGLGIGLTLVERLVDMHHGRVYARSAGPGRGSEFIVHLPLAAAAPADNDAPSSAQDFAAAGENQNRTVFRILVVDDNKDAADALGELLQVLGHEVRIAYDGLQALAAAEQFYPEVVLLDLGMPKLDGYETARRIRAQPWGGQTLLIALTGWGQEDDKRRTAAAGLDHHLVKPVDIDAIRQLLAAHLSGPRQTSRSDK